MVSIKGKETRRATALLFPLEAEPPWEGLSSLKASTESLPSNATQTGLVGSASSSAQTIQSPPRTRYGRVIRLPQRF